MNPMIERARERFRWVAGGGLARPNPFGLGTAISGLAVGWICATLLLDLWPHRGAHLGTFTSDVLGLVGLWVGFVGAALAGRALFRASSSSLVADPLRREARRGGYFASLRADYGIGVRAIDLPIGVAAGLFGQYLLAPAAEAPLLPFVPHLYSRLSGPALSISRGVTGLDLVVLGVLICLIGPAVEELYFRGLLLRGLLGRFAGLSPVLSVAPPILLCAVYFALVHLEPIVILGLFAFGVLLGWLAWWSGRLGPGYIAHVTFNAVAFVALVRAH